MVRLTRSEDHLNEIKRMAQEKWGTDLTRYKKPAWEAALVAEYVRLYNQQNPDNQVTANQRRSQIMRAIDTGKCMVETLILLYGAVDCEIKIVQERSV